MLWNVVVYIALVGAQYLLTVGMSEPDRSAMRSATWVSAVALGVPLFGVIALVRLGIL